jgi:hypothetical protein
MELHSSLGPVATCMKPDQASQKTLRYQQDLNPEIRPHLLLAQPGAW